MMKYVYMTLIVLVTVAVVIFMVQNLASVKVAFLNMSLTMPVGILILLVYMVGMLTGGAVLELLRAWVHGATQKPE
jgi:uncharacterized integral membrane protein